MQVTYIEIAGFRSFGAEPQRIDIASPLVVIHGENSQGKTSLAEAFEFLLTGATSRRLLGGGSPQEHSSALRNVHLPTDAEVYVEAGFKVNSQEHVVRRVLTKDYEGAGELESRLTIDGASASSLASVGVVLADPPISAPVLLEHALRYAVSAKPADRSAFFRAIIEATDLDEIRTTIDSVLAARKNRPQDVRLRALNEVRSVPQFASLLSKIKAPTSEQVAEELRAALRLLVPQSPLGTKPDCLMQATEDVRNELARRQQEVFPINNLLLSRTEPPNLYLNHVGVEYDEAVSSVDDHMAALLPIFHAVLDTNVISSADHPVNCPVCQTPVALTPERIQAMREEVAARDGLSQAQQAIAGSLRSVRQQLDQLRNWIETTPPRTAKWTAEQEIQARRVLHSHGAGVEGFESYWSKVEWMCTRVSEVESAIVKADLTAAQAEGKVKAMTPLGSTLADLQESISSARQAVNEFDAEYQRVLALAESFVQQVKPFLADTSSTNGWQELLELCPDPGSLAAALTAVEQERRVEARIRSAQRAIVGATKTVIDQRLTAMAAEIRKWWSLLRPGELTTFGDLTRRGAGNKLLDFTAALIPTPEGKGEVRNALAVLSTSQMNALGLATFIARCRRSGSSVILLDDPVPASDPEHRLGFADAVVQGLLESGMQVIIATHDPELARSVETIHGHRQPEKFGVAIPSPLGGSQFERRGDDFENRLLEAQTQMHSPLHANRRAAGNSLRIATERLAKHILVEERRKAGDTTAKLSDYDNKNLKDLRPKVIQFAVMPNEPGMWQQLAHILNNADHDTDPPKNSDLKRCYDWLRDIKNKHGVKTGGQSS